MKTWGIAHVPRKRNASVWLLNPSFSQHATKDAAFVFGKLLATGSAKMDTQVVMIPTICKFT